MRVVRWLAKFPDALLRRSGIDTRRGAVTVVAKLTTPRLKVADVIATADADVAAVVPHGLGVRPLEVTLTKILSQALAAESAWTVGTVDETNVNLVKLATAGSGNAAAQIRVIARTSDVPVS